VGYFFLSYDVNDLKKSYDCSLVKIFGSLLNTTYSNVNRAQQTATIFRLRIES
jgi:hypothetical protein